MLHKNKNLVLRKAEKEAEAKAAADAKNAKVATANAVDPAGRKGQKWNKKSWGSRFKEDAIPRFKEHLYMKRHIVGPIADKTCADSK